jgi:predicted amidohydrolase
MKAKAREHKICIVSTIFEVARPGLYYDTAMLIGPDGEIAGKYRKVHPAAYLSLEKIYFRGGADEQIVCADIEREVVEQARRRFHFSRDRRPDAYDAITRPMEELQR